jgi:hypothetical protein
VATSIKVSATSKDLLDRIQAKITLTKGKKISQNDLIDALIRVSLDHEEELLNVASGGTPANLDDLNKLLQLATDWGVETRSDEIDEYLYGTNGRGRP